MGTIPRPLFGTSWTPFQGPNPGDIGSADKHANDPNSVTLGCTRGLGRFGVRGTLFGTPFGPAQTLHPFIPTRSPVPCLHPTPWIPRGLRDTSYPSLGAPRDGSPFGPFRGPQIGLETPFQTLSGRGLGPPKGYRSPFGPGDDPPEVPKWVPFGVLNTVSETLLAPHPMDPQRLKGYQLS